MLLESNVSGLARYLRCYCEVNSRLVVFKYNGRCFLWEPDVGCKLAEVQNVFGTAT